MSDYADGTVVDGRYRIERRIGSGGMADVYLAEDTHLGRQVALKVLHRRFAQDAEFVERFRREASAAAGLQHPHVVGVYDRGEHEGTYYIAMEYLRGRTLKEVLSEEAPVDQRRAIDIAVQILAAAGFAHRNGVVHRDFKPHNVILDDQGTVKVTDFGIARAGASEMTETGSIMGTAQYLSPEQAQGQEVTPRSDIYSIGVMLYELLTGKLPFEGESAVAIALKHMSEPPPAMSREGLAIEPNLEAVVLGALAKEPAARWQSAEDFAAALEACRPYVEAFLAGDAVGDDTAVFAAVPAPADSAARERPRRWPAVAIAVAALALIALMAFIFTRPEQIDVPKVTGLQLSEARERLDRAGFEDVEVERERSLAELDEVLRQDPDAGEQAARGDTIVLVVSDGPGEVTVPRVRNMTRAQALRELRRSDLRATVTERASANVEAGRAIGTAPSGGETVQRRTNVRLFVSSGPEQVEVPNLVGQTLDSATGQLDDAGLAYRIVREESERPEDEVLAQDPGGGAFVDPGATVTLTVAEPVAQVSVPFVTDLSEAQALRALRAEGLVADVQERDVQDPDQDGVVIQQRPAAGRDVDEGSTVTIVVGRYVEPTPPPTTPTTPEGEAGP
ncbi:MAG: serine/threonine protein kinase [Solirubrobacterales bacterium]|nr:serine/threonine protein kinase [Solirubrobacterales bacterium]